MKILYGAHATGNGHISRAFTLAKAFAKRNNIEVDYFFSGRERNKYFDMEVFGNYQIRDGISFVHYKGCMKRWETMKGLKLLTFYKDVRFLDLSSYDLVIVDGEPVTAWAAKLQKKPSISISHLFSYYHDEISKANKGYSIDRFVTKHLTPCNVNLGIFWHHFSSDNILPPFVEEQSAMQSSSVNDRYLVYLPFEHVDDIKAALKPFKGIDFFCYHPDITENKDEDCVKWRIVSRIEFKNFLRECAGIISNGGFYLASECLQLGKKLLIKPLLGQWEQLSNAFILSRFGLAQSMEILNTEKIEQWLEQPASEPILFPHDPTPLIDWIVAGDWDDTASLCKRLWDEVYFPDTLQDKLKEYTKIQAA